MTLEEIEETQKWLDMKENGVFKECLLKKQIKLQKEI